MERQFKPFPELKTQRLTLRQLVDVDASQIFALRSNDQVNRYLGRTPSKSIDDAETFIAAINQTVESRQALYWAIELNTSGKLIGTICLFGFTNDNSEAEIGYELLPDFQGKGIMKEAASSVIEYSIRDLKLKSIKAYTHAENQSSTKLLEKLNFKKHEIVDDNFNIFKLEKI